MRSFIAIPLLATAALATTSSPAPVDNAACQALYSQCMTEGSANPGDNSYIQKCIAKRDACLGKATSTSVSSTILINSTPTGTISSSASPVPASCKSGYDVCTQHGGSINDCKAKEDDCKAPKTSSGAWNATWTTTVVTSYTTVCPSATTFTSWGKTYTATGSETITLDCPCTISTTVAPTATGFPISPGATTSGSDDKPGVSSSIGSSSAKAPASTGTSSPNDAASAGSSAANGASSTGSSPANGASQVSSATPSAVQFEGAANRAGPVVGLVGFALGALALI